MGQGARAVLAQIAAEVLAIPFERVGVATPDTAITPYDQTTSSSRSTVMMGRAVEDAALDVRGQLLHIAAGLAVPPGDRARRGIAAPGRARHLISWSASA
jgi:CO/xanthine dehydrogenase Mo-binding subunit